MEKEANIRFNSDVFAVLNYRSSFKKSAAEVLLKIIFKRKLIINNIKTKSSKNFQGVVFLPTTLGEKIKIFDFKNKLVLTKFFNDREYEKKYKIINILINFFQCHIYIVKTMKTRY